MYDRKNFEVGREPQPCAFCGGATRLYETVLELPLHQPCAEACWADMERVTQILAARIGPGLHYVKHPDGSGYTSLVAVYEASDG